MTAKISTIVLGLGLAFFIALAARGFKAPAVHTSSAVIKPLVPPKDLKPHLFGETTMAAIREASPTLPELSDKVLARRLEMKPLQRDGQMELKASAPDKTAADELLRSWLDVSHRTWTGPRPNRLEPFIRVESP